MCVLLASLTACAATSSSSSDAYFHKRIGINRANELASDFLVSRRLDWGSPVSMRIEENYVVFFYSTAASAASTKTPHVDESHALLVDIHSGDVRFAPH